MLANGEKNRVEFTAQDRAAEWVEALGWMKEPENIEDHANDLKLSVKHPYWKPHIDDLALRILEGQVEVLKAICARREELETPARVEKR